MRKIVPLLTAYVEGRRKVRRAEFAVALLRQEAANLRVGRDRERESVARYLESVADSIEASP